jgi:hypothetical protein
LAENGSVISEKFEKRLITDEDGPKMIEKLQMVVSVR